MTSLEISSVSNAICMLCTFQASNNETGDGHPGGVDGMNKFDLQRRY